MAKIRWKLLYLVYGGIEFVLVGSPIIDFCWTIPVAQCRSFLSTRLVSTNRVNIIARVNGRTIRHTCIVRNDKAISKADCGKTSFSYARDFIIFNKHLEGIAVDVRLWLPAKDMPWDFRWPLPHKGRGRIYFLCCVLKTWWFDGLDTCWYSVCIWILDCFINLIFSFS